MERGGLEVGKQKALFVRVDIPRLAASRGFSYDEMI